LTAAGKAGCTCAKLLFLVEQLKNNREQESHCMSPTLESTSSMSHCEEKCDTVDLGIRFSSSSGQRPSARTELLIVAFNLPVHAVKKNDCGCIFRVNVSIFWDKSRHRLKDHYVSEIKVFVHPYTL